MSIKIVQKIVPTYRIKFFNLLSKEYNDEFQVWTSFNKKLGPVSEYEIENYKWLKNIGKTSSFFGFYWQSGTFRINIKRNDIIIIEGSLRIISNFIIILRCFYNKGIIIWWGHYKSASSKKIFSFIRLKLMKFLPVILFYVDEEAIEYKKKYNHPNVFALNNGVDLEEINLFREKYDSCKRVYDICFLGRFTDKAQMNILFDAIKYDQCLQYSLILFGAKDQVEINYISKKLEEENLLDRVRVVNGSTDEKNIAKFVNNSKVFCYPGHVGLSLIHSMGYGLPSVVHNNKEKQMPEYVSFQNNITGMSFEYESPKSLADTLNSILSNQERLKTMSNNVINKVKSRFTLNLMRKNFIQMINSITNK